MSGLIYFTTFHITVGDRSHVQAGTSVRSILYVDLDVVVGILTVFTLLPLVRTVGDHREPGPEPGQKNEDDSGYGGHDLVD